MTEAQCALNFHWRLQAARSCVGGACSRSIAIVPVGPGIIPIVNADKVGQVSSVSSFAQTLDAIESLPVEEQEDVLEVLQRRLAERRRAELIAIVKQSRNEDAAGRCKPASVAAIMRRVKAAAAIWP